MPSRSHRAVFPPASTSGLVRRFTLSGLALAISTTLLATPAQAYSNLYLFGDSLSDSGQFPDTTLGGLNSLRFTNRSGPDYENSAYVKWTPSFGPPDGSSKLGSGHHRRQATWVSG